MAIYVGSAENELLKVRSCAAFGPKGDKGDTPIKGVDYWTETDKAELVAEVVAQLVDGNEVAY